MEATHEEALQQANQESAALAAKIEKLSTTSSDLADVNAALKRAEVKFVCVCFLFVQKRFSRTYLHTHAIFFEKDEKTQLQQELTRLKEQNKQIEDALIESTTKHEEEIKEAQTQVVSLQEELEIKTSEMAAEIQCLQQQVEELRLDQREKTDSYSRQVSESTVCVRRALSVFSLTKKKVLIFAI